MQDRAALENDYDIPTREEDTAGLDRGEEKREKKREKKTKVKRMIRP